MGRDGKQTAEIGNRVFLPDDSGLRHHHHVDRQPIATEREKLWITLLSSAIGYALPSTTLKVAKP